MALYTKDSIERVRDAVDMVELVGARSDLRRQGARWTGLCPFHDERTPSFSVNAEHKLYHCFGCGESGDAIRFVEATEGLDFRGAVELLADRYGVELKREREELAAAGLGQPGRRGGFIDRFRGRIIFPLADARGRVLGFGARSLREDQRPKYLNTSENELYHKGRQLFGVDRARAVAARRGRIVAVEGYTDVLALHQGGITESVAIMGTALTQEQLAELSRAAGSGGEGYLAPDARPLR